MENLEPVSFHLCMMKDSVNLEQTITTEKKGGLKGMPKHLQQDLHIMLHLSKQVPVLLVVFENGTISLHNTRLDPLSHVVTATHKLDSLSEIIEIVNYLNR